MHLQRRALLISSHCHWVDHIDRCQVAIDTGDPMRAMPAEASVPVVRRHQTAAGERVVVCCTLDDNKFSPSHIEPRERQLWQRGRRLIVGELEGEKHVIHEVGALRDLEVANTVTVDGKVAIIVMRDDAPSRCPK